MLPLSSASILFFDAFGLGTGVCPSLGKGQCVHTIPDLPQLMCMWCPSGSSGAGLPHSPAEAEGKLQEGLAAHTQGVAVGASL